MCLVSNSQGNYITRKHLTGQLELTNNKNLAYCFNEAEADILVKQYGKEFGNLKIERM